MHTYLYYVFIGVECIRKMLGETFTPFCKHALHIINGFVVLVTISDAYVVPEAPETFLFQHPIASIGA